MTMTALVDRIDLLHAATLAAEDYQKRGDDMRAATLAKIMERETTADGPWWTFQRRPVTEAEAKEVFECNFRWHDNARVYWNIAAVCTMLAENARCSKLSQIRIDSDQITYLRPHLGYQADE